MDFSELSNLRAGIMPFLAILGADLVSLFKTKITYGWLIIGIFLQFTRVLSTALIVGPALTIAEGFTDFIVIWSFVIIGITASTVSSEAGELADSIMSKSVKRHHYILAKFTSRIGYVLIIFFLVISVLVIGSLRGVNQIDYLRDGTRINYELLGVIAAILFVALTLTMLTALGVTLSNIITKGPIAIVSLLVIWYSMTLFFPIWDLEFLSPTYLVSLLPDVIQGLGFDDVWITVASYATITITAIIISTIIFSTKDL